MPEYSRINAEHTSISLTAFAGRFYTQILKTPRRRIPVESPPLFRGGCAVYYQSNVAALADVALPVEEFRARVARDALLIVGFTLFVALFARFSVHLPFTPVPVTGQTFAVLLTGATLGSWRGAIALSLYLMVGMFLPSFRRFPPPTHISGTPPLAITCSASLPAVPDSSGR